MTIPGFAQLNLLGKIVSIVAPLAIVAALWFGANWMLDNAYDNGAESRQTEVDTLTNKASGLEGKLTISNAETRAAQLTISELRGQIIADAEAYASSLKGQAEINKAAQQATSNAMRAMASQRASHEDFMAGLNTQLEGVSYEQDQDGRCVIRGGGIVLQNAANGKR